MWILLVPFYLISAVVWLFVLYAAWRTVKAARARSASALAWGAIVLLPFAAFYGERSWADMRAAARAREVAAIKRNPIPDTYPRTLEIQGFMTTRELMIYLDALAIDEVVMLQSRAHRRENRAEIITLASECRGRGRAYLEEWVRRNRLGYETKADKDCLVRAWRTIDGDRDDVPAIVFMLDDRTTLKMPGNGLGGGNYEARIRTAGDSLLLNYWEWPNIDKPASPLLLAPNGFMLRELVSWKLYRNDGRIGFFARAVGLAPPGSVADAVSLNFSHS